MVRVDGTRSDAALSFTVTGNFTEGSPRVFTETVAGIVRVRQARPSIRCDRGAVARKGNSCLRSVRFGVRTARSLACCQTARWHAASRPLRHGLDRRQWGDIHRHHPAVLPGPSGAEHGRRHHESEPAPAGCASQASPSLAYLSRGGLCHRLDPARNTAKQNARLELDD